MECLVLILFRFGAHQLLLHIMIKNISFSFPFEYGSLYLHTIQDWVCIKMDLIYTVVRDIRLQDRYINAYFTKLGDGIFSLVAFTPLGDRADDIFVLTFTFQVSPITEQQEEEAEIRGVKQEEEEEKRKLQFPQYQRSGV